jgi:hypothetical protein
MRFSKKALIATGTGAVAALAIGGLALAYWTTTGSGTGSATNATANGTLGLHASFTPGLTPGASEAVSYTADNTNSSSLQVGTVTAVVSIDSAHATAGCLAADFTVPPVIENQTIAAGQSGVALAHDGLITFADTAVNQDACQGATVSLALTS